MTPNTLAAKLMAAIKHATQTRRGTTDAAQQEPLSFAANQHTVDIWKEHMMPQGWTLIHFYAEITPATADLDLQQKRSIQWTHAEERTGLRKAGLELQPLKDSRYLQFNLWSSDDEQKVANQVEHDHTEDNYKVTAKP